jgi:DNA-binding PadR family transcriptional regulator
MLRRDRGLEGFGVAAIPSRGKRRHARTGRLFDQGDLKYVVLRLLGEKPRHGYDIIRALEDLLGGVYSPSPGTVYPTLTLLASAGFAAPRQGLRGRKMYEITAEGRAWLAEHAGIADAIFERIARYTEGLLEAPMVDVNAAFRRLERAAYRQAARGVNDAERLQRVREILDQAAAALDAMSRPPARRPPDAP